MTSKYYESYNLFLKGKLKDALEVSKEAFEEGTINFGADHKYTIEVQYLMATVLGDLRRYEEALYHSRESHRKNLLARGADHPRTLIMQRTIAMILGKQEKYEEALILHQEVYDKQEKYLGASHEETLITLNNLTIIIAKQGGDVLMRYESIYNKLKAANSNTPNILLIRSQIANQLSKQGQFAEALEILSEVNAINNLNRPRHLDTFNCLDITATVLSKQGKLNDALEMSDQVLKSKAEMFGPDHPHTLRTLTSLRTIENSLITQKNFRQRLGFLQELYRKRKDVLGPTHDETLVAHGKIAEMMLDLRKYDKALSIYKEIYEIRKELCSDLSNTFDFKTRLNIGIISNLMGKHDEALSIFKEMIELQKSMAPDDPEVLETQIRFARTLGYQNNYDEAFKILIKVWKTQESRFGPEHEHTLTTRIHVALLIQNQGKTEQALNIFFEVLESLKNSNNANPSDSFVTQILYHIADIYCLQGKLAEALQAYAVLYASELMNKCEDYPTVLTIQNNIATILIRQGKYSEAFEKLKDVYEKRFSALGKEDPLTLNSEQSLKYIIRKLKL